MVSYEEGTTVENNFNMPEKIHQQLTKLFQAQQHDKIIARCKTAAQDPRYRKYYPQLAYYRACAHRRQQEYLDAIYFNTQLIEMPGVPKLWRALAYNDRGLSELLLGNYNNAAKDFTQAANHDKRNEAFAENLHQCQALQTQRRAEKQFAIFTQELINNVNRVVHQSLKTLAAADPTTGLPVTAEKEAVTQRILARLRLLTEKSFSAKATIAQLSGELISTKATLRKENVPTLMRITQEENQDNQQVQELNYLTQLLIKAEKEVQAQTEILGAAHDKSMEELDECVTATGVAQKNNADLARAAKNDPNLRQQLTAVSESHIRQYRANFITLNLKVNLLNLLAQTAEKLIELGHVKQEKLNGPPSAPREILVLYEKRTEEIIYYRQTIQEIAELTDELNKYNQSLLLFYMQGKDNIVHLTSVQDYKNYWINIEAFNKRYQARELRAQIECAAGLILRQDKIVDLTELAATLPDKFYPKVTPAREH